MPATTTNLLLRKPLASEAPDGAGQIGNLADDIEDRFGRTAAQASALAAGTRYGQRALVGAIEYRWNGTIWQPWDSEWTTFNPSGNGVAFSNTNALIRYRSGEAAMEFGSGVNGMNSQQVTLSVPAAFGQTTLTNAQPKGTVQLVTSDGTVYPILPSLTGTTIYMGYIASGQTATAPSSGNALPIAWQGNTLKVSLSWAIQ